MTRYDVLKENIDNINAVAMALTVMAARIKEVCPVDTCLFHREICHKCLTGWDSVLREKIVER